MSYHVSTFALVSAFAAWGASLVAMLAWLRRDLTPGARSLFWLMLAIAEWSLGAAVELTVTSLPAKILWSKVEYLGTLSTAVLMLIFAIEVTGSSAWLTRRRIALLFVIPGVTFLLAVTNERHGLIWSGFHPSPDGGNLVVFERGIAFWIGVVGYAYLCLLAGTVLLVRAALGLPRAFRRQAVTLLVAVAIPWLANGSYVFGVFPIVGLDPTPLAMGAMGCVCALAILRFGLLDPRPAAREMVIERMPGGVVVFDDQDRVLEVNPAARRLLGSRAPELGSRLDLAFAAWPALVEAARAGTEARLELSLPHGDEVDARTAVADVAILGEQAGHTGRVLVLHDVTDRYRAEGELREANHKLAEQLADIAALEASVREQAMRDSLTGLYNRRYLDETLPRELARAERTEEPLAVVLVDLDRFKELNDRHGHAAGDEVLRELGLLLRANTRKSDITCRYGGEEFLVVMPATDIATAVDRASHLREAFERTSFRKAAAGVTCTLSAGVAAFPAHATTHDGLLAAADLALYAAKAAGRDRVVAAQWS